MTNALLFTRMLLVIITLTLCVISYNNMKEKKLRNIEEYFNPVYVLSRVFMVLFFISMFGVTIV